MAAEVWRQGEGSEPRPRRDRLDPGQEARECGADHVRVELPLETSSGPSRGPGELLVVLEQPAQHPSPLLRVGQIPEAPRTVVTHDLRNAADGRGHRGQSGAERLDQHEGTVLHNRAVDVHPVVEQQPIHVEPLAEEGNLVFDTQRVREALELRTLITVTHDRQRVAVTLSTGGCYHPQQVLVVLAFEEASYADAVAAGLGGEPQVVAEEEVRHDRT